MLGALCSRLGRTERVEDAGGTLNNLRFADRYLFRAIVDVSLSWLPLVSDWLTVSSVRQEVVSPDEVQRYFSDYLLAERKYRRLNTMLSTSLFKPGSSVVEKPEGSPRSRSRVQAERTRSSDTNQPITARFHDCSDPRTLTRRAEK